MKHYPQSKWPKIKQYDEGEEPAELTKEERQVVMEEFYEITDRCAI